MIITIHAPIRIVSVANVREHWSRRARSSKAERATMFMLCMSKFAQVGRPRLPVRVTLTRVAPRKLDGDNAISGCKAIRDGICDALGVDDGDTDAVTFEYAQKSGGPKVYELHCVIEENRPSDRSIYTPRSAFERK